MTFNETLRQIDAVDLSTIANIATALTVLTAVVFGLIEMRHARKEREERAAFVAVQAILTPAWMRSMVLVQTIPDGVTASKIEADPRILEAAQSIGIILEGLGYAVFARMVPLNVVDELMGGTVNLGMVSVARRTARSAQQGPNQSHGRRARRLPRLAAINNRALNKTVAAFGNAS